MASSGSVFSETLQEITKTKLEELSKRRNNFETSKAAVLASLDEETDKIARIKALSSGVKRCLGVAVDKNGAVVLRAGKQGPLEIELKNLDRFLEQARHDPSVSAKMLDAWEASLLGHLGMQSLKFQYADLYGQLVTEWLSGDRKQAPKKADADVEMADDFEHVGSAAKLQARAEWEKTVFEPANVDVKALKRYLATLFGAGGDPEKEKLRDALEKLRSDVAVFETSMSDPTQFTNASLLRAITGLLSSDLLTNEKREVLRDFKSNNVILAEIADVLIMRIAALQTWSWGDRVLLEQHRKISGVYHVKMHEDLLQAIFLQHIGVKWSVFFKRAFTTFRRAKGAWTPRRNPVSKTDKKRLGYYLGPVFRNGCLQDRRRDLYNKDYFLAQLLSSETQQVHNADGEEEADWENAAEPASDFISHGFAASSPIPMYKRGPGAGGAKRHRKIATFRDDEASDSEDDRSGDGDDDAHTATPKNTMKLKQQILHILSTEIAMGTSLHGEVTAFHSVFESWAPLLPHQTVLAVLGFFGVSEPWLSFFQNFLEAPLKFLDDDDTVSTRKRLRGTPASHTLSDLFGESILFCLDFSVNQATEGQTIWRIHDDVWFWSNDETKAVTAWKTMDNFARVTGTKLNPVKTGAVRVDQASYEPRALSELLPKGEIRWGFLRLSSTTGRFEIDQTMVDKHIEELQKQLVGSNKSVFAFIQTWNTYADTFFSANFGKPACCYGVEHVDDMLRTHQRIQKEIFSSFATSFNETGATSVADHLKKTIETRFGIADVPDGYIFFPVEMGGLDLKSPFVTLLQIRDSCSESPSAMLEAFHKGEREGYQAAKERFYSSEIEELHESLAEPDWKPESKQEQETFLGFEDYTRFREELRFEDNGVQVHDLFSKMLVEPSPSTLSPDTGKISSALRNLTGNPRPRGIFSNWASMEPYWQWVTMLYGPEIVDRFGGLNIVDSGLLPMGMVSIFREKRVTWEG
ncbi:hypothetical protein BN1723_004687, partial [Verticillium longisporum]